MTKLRKYEKTERKIDLFDEKKALENAKGNVSMVEFARRLCLCLDKRNLNEADLCRDLKLGKASVNAYVKAEQIPNADKIIKMANYFNVSTDYLLGLSNFKSTKDDWKIVNKVTGLNDYAIEVLNEFKKNAKNEKEEDNVFTSSQILKTINYLISKEPESKVFEYIGSYLWHTYDTTSNLYYVNESTKELELKATDDVKIIRDKQSGEDLIIPSSQFNKLFILNMEEQLYKLEEEIRRKKE